MIKSVEIIPLGIVETDEIAPLILSPLLGLNATTGRKTRLLDTCIDDGGGYTEEVEVAEDGTIDTISLSATDFMHHSQHLGISFSHETGERSLNSMADERHHTGNLFACSP